MNGKRWAIVFVAAVAVGNVMAVAFFSITYERLEKLEGVITKLESQIETQRVIAAQREEQISNLKADIGKVKFQPVTVENGILEEVRLKRLILVGDNNQPQYVLEQDGNAAVQKFLGQNGETRIQIGILEDDISRMALFDHEGMPTVKISGAGSVDAGARASVALYNEGAKLTMNMGTRNDVAGLWTLDPETGLPSSSLQNVNGKFSGVVVFNKKGSTALSLGRSESIFHGLQILDNSGIVRNATGVHYEKNLAFIEQFSSKGEPRYFVQSGSGEVFNSFAYQSGGARMWEGLSNLSTIFSLKNLLK